MKHIRTVEPEWVSMSYPEFYDHGLKSLQVGLLVGTLCGLILGILTGFRMAGMI